MTDTNEPYWNRMVPELTVTDFPASLNFYTEVLGFSVMIRRTEPDFAYTCLGEAQLMLEQYHQGGWNTAELAKPLERGVNFQIEVDGIEEIFARVKAHRVTRYLQALLFTITSESRMTSASLILAVKWTL